MISKALLSEVLGIPLLHIRYNNTTNLYEIFKEDLFNWSDGSYGRWSNLEVNIYELAHKCKAWALNLGYILYSAVHGYECYIDSRNFIDNTPVRFLSESEPEAIFKACQWILTKDSK